MAIDPPLIDIRTEADFAAQTQTMLGHYLAGPPYLWQRNDDGGEAGKALTGIFARYCHLLTTRINAAPDKNQLAFLGLLGNALGPALPAEAQLTFELEEREIDGLPVAKGTQVQASVTDAAGLPLIFETKRDLWLTNFELVAMSKKRTSGSQEVDVTPLIMRPARKADRIQPDERLFDEVETFYFGLALRPNRVFDANRPITFHMFIGDTLYDPTHVTTPGNSPNPVVWEYGAGPGAVRWKELIVEDGTHGLTQSGTVDFLVPPDFAAAQRHLFEKKLYWIRARLVGGHGGVYAQGSPRLYGVSLNTVAALQRTCIRDEVLGSANDQADQVFTAFRKPVLPGEVLEVRERSVTPDGVIGGTGAAWTRWTEVSDFHASGPSERHYIVQRQAGEFRFGNGRNGMIPPPGVRNLRLATYWTGGGDLGNVAANTITTLVASNRRIASVTNLVAAQGGADTELPAAMRHRAPRALRHRDRAVAFEDYGDLARQASSQVARAMCVPLIDLALYPSRVINAVDDERLGAGTASVVIVPRGSIEQPLPSQELLTEVQSFLRQRVTPTVSLSVVGPLYLRVDIAVRVVLASRSLFNLVEQEMRARLSAFLHPLSGRDGAGWPFGRHPQTSDFHRLLGDVPSVRFVSSLAVTLRAEGRPFDCPAGVDTLTCIARTKRFLICSGRHSIVPVAIP